MGESEKRQLCATVKELGWRVCARAAAAIMMLDGSMRQRRRAGGRWDFAAYLDVFLDLDSLHDVMLDDGRRNWQSWLFSSISNIQAQKRQYAKKSVGCR